MLHKATEKDIPLLNQLIREGKGYWGYPENGLERFFQTFGIANGTYFEKGFGFLAETEDQVMGYILFKFQEDRLELDHFGLDTQFIGQGYGRPLWDHTVMIAQAEGWKEFMFWADPHALGFYEHMGAVKVGERPMVTLPGHMAPIMRFVIPKKA